MNIPLTRRPAPRPPRSDSDLLRELVHRTARIESRLVRLMKHVGMKDDGRSPLPPDDVERAHSP